MCEEYDEVQERDIFLFATLLFYKLPFPGGKITTYRLSDSKIYLYGRSKTLLKTFKRSTIEGLISGSTYYRTAEGQTITSEMMWRAVSPNQSLGLAGEKAVYDVV